MATLYVTDRDGNEHALEAETGLPIMEAIREIDGGVEALCGGMCSCATCHVYIDAPWSEQSSWKTRNVFTPTDRGCPVRSS
jgi:2Fe-2S ferredoxin